MKETLRLILSIGAGLLSFGIGTSFLSWPFFLTLPLAVGVYLGVYTFAKPTVKIGNIKVDSLRNGEALKSLMNEGLADLNAIRRGATNSKEPTIRENANQLYRTGVRIYEYLKDNPDKIPVARRFLTYYLDTAAGILDKYIKLEKTGVVNQNMFTLTRQTENALLTLDEAFKKQFSNLVTNEVIDIEADIQLLEQTLKLEG